MEPVLFAPEVFKEQMHTAPVFSPDGQEVFWRAASELQIKFMRLVDGRWSAPRIASFAERASADCPVFSPDGSRLYFISTRWRDQTENGGTDENIWYVERASQVAFSELARLLPDTVNSLTLHWTFSIASSGDLYFAALPPEGGQEDIYRAELVDGAYVDAERLGPAINTDRQEHCPYVARDGSYLIFTRVSEDLLDGDLYASFRQEDGSWGEAIPMATLNSVGAHDLCAWVSDDGKYLFFNSTRTGELLAYWVDAQVIEELRPR